MAGYSGTPLPRKLGIGPGARVLLVQAPRNFDLGPEVPDDAVVDSAPAQAPRRAGAPPYDVVLLFTTAQDDLADRLPGLTERVPPAGAVWVCWPKKTAARAQGILTDMTEDVVREVALPMGLVDVKVAAVDQTWSGLKLVRRLALR